MVRLLIIALLSSGCWQSRVKKLSDEEYQHYYALRAWMDDTQKKTYLKLKTEEERTSYLKKQGLWDRFYKYEPHIRERIVDGLVQEGWTKDMVFMAWGAPYDKRKLAGRKAERSELLVFRFEEMEDGSIIVWAPGSKTEYKAIRLFSKEIILDDDVVKEIAEKNSW